MAVITISRQFGAGGYTLGKRVAERLGYRLIQKELITEIAEKARVSPGGIKGFEKSTGSRIMKIVDSLISKNYITKLLEGRHGYVDETQYTDILREIVEELYQEGNVVIIGRGAQFVLRGREDVVHVLLVRDVAGREKFLMDLYGVTRERARATIKSEDLQRCRVLETFCKGDCDDPIHYDLVINTGYVSMATAEELLLTLVRPREAQALGATG